MQKSLLVNESDQHRCFCCLGSKSIIPLVSIPLLAFDAEDPDLCVYWPVKPILSFIAYYIYEALYD